MLDPSPLASAASRPSMAPPFRRVLCAVEGREQADAAAIEQAIAVAGRDARVEVAASWFGGGSAGRAVRPEKQARHAVARAVDRARAAGVDTGFRLMHAPHLSEALL